VSIQQSFQKYVRKCFKFWKTELTGQSTITQPAQCCLSVGTVSQFTGQSTSQSPSSRALQECKERRIMRYLALSGSDCAMQHLPSISLSAFCTPPWQTTLLARSYIILASSPTCYATPCPATPHDMGLPPQRPPHSYLTSKPPTNDTYVNRWFLNNAINYREQLETTVIDLN
jgi:hypothetical protein